ncbi:unnamed protein product [Bemisia tabaci]|uniref:snRNA-activating protein complex subunit 4 n=1 Tax=Bemisia tabaci TaxID=7038 RepID=A0A9P0A240_BEMTA|nr:unnamed protein product [Bemisia tabaci]
MADQYLVFPGTDEPSTSRQHGTVVVPQLTNRSGKLLQILNSIPDVESDEESDGEEVSSLAPGQRSGSSSHPPKTSSHSKMTDVLTNLDQLSFSLERLIVQKLEEIDVREAEINGELMEIQKLIEVDKVSYNKNSVSCFGMPYFKTLDLQPFPVNEDYRLKLENDEFIYHDLPTTTFWSTNEILMLENAVGKEIKNGTIKRSYDSSEDPWMRRKDRIKASNSSDKAPFVEILEHEDEDFDWNKIATINFRDRHSAEECKRMWRLYAKPSILKRPWSKEEDNKLKKAAEKNNYQDWDEIAKELDTGRSGYQCFMQYKRRLAPINKLGKWTEEEDKLLTDIIEQCRIGSYIPWTKVLYYFEHRSLRQLFNRWKYSLNPQLKKGHFTRSEDFGLCVGVSLYGKNFKKIASILGNRSAAQIRERYKAKMNDSRSGSWTIEEDQQLIELFNKYGDKKWSQISKHLSRDRTQCRLRYKRLKNKYNFNLDIIKRNVKYRPLHTYEKQWFKQYFANGKDENTLKAVSKNLSLIKKRGRKGKSGTLMENQLVDYFSESYSESHKNSFKNLTVVDETKLEGAAEVIVQLLKLFKANLCFPKNISENFIRARDSNQVVNSSMLKLMMLVAKSYNAEGGATSYNNFSVDADNDFAVTELDPLKETKIDYDPSKFAHLSINLERSFQTSYNQASMSSLLYGDTGEFYVEPKPVVTENNDPIAVPAESSGFNLQQLHSRSNFSNEASHPSVSEEKAKVETQLDYLIPPCASSMVSLRTYMLARRKLWKMIGKQEFRERSKLPMHNLPNKLSPLEAHNLAISRFSSLLFWPMFLSAHRPSKFGIKNLAEESVVIANDKSSLGSGEDSDADAEDFYVKTFEPPAPPKRIPKKNTVLYRKKLKLDKKAEKLKANAHLQKNCDSVKPPELIGCDSSLNIEQNLAAKVSPGNSNLQTSSKDSETKTKNDAAVRCTTMKTGTKRKNFSSVGTRRSQRLKQPKVDEEIIADPEVKEEQVETVDLT